ncbi:MAG: amidohydrolase [Halodesulfurarchaeum sp.]|nr:amidohydrolase [Halodesulfurarchaeum sp.]
MSTIALTDGHVLHPDGSVSQADVLVDRSQGEIRAVGQGLTGDRTLSAAGGLVMPGLVNAHTHAAMTLLRGYADDKPLDDWLKEDIWPAEAALEPEDVRAGTELALLEMIRSGTTAFADMYFHMDEAVTAVNQAGLRARLSHGIVTVGKDDADAEADVGEGIEFARRTKKTAPDRIRPALSPHSLTTVNEDALRNTVEAARDLDIPLHIHANETEAEVEPIVEEHGLRPLEYAAEQGLLESQDFLAHGVHLDEAEVELLAERTPSVVHCPASNMKLASGMAQVERLGAAGVPLALGTDGAASNNDMDMFGEMRDAALLGKLAADDASAVPAEAVIRMATEGGARALGLPGGRIEAGAAADLIVVDFQDPRLTPVHKYPSHLVYAATGSDVRHTIVDGQPLMTDREVSVLDETAVREGAEERAARLAERA